jgi:hypothetical protein
MFLQSGEPCEETIKDTFLDTVENTYNTYAWLQLMELQLVFTRDLHCAETAVSVKKDVWFPTHQLTCQIKTSVYNRARGLLG